MQGRSACYRIRVAGRLDEGWTDWFGSAQVTLADNDETTIFCEEMDQAALHGLLRIIRDLGLPLIAVCRVASGEQSAGKGDGAGEEEAERED